VQENGVALDAEQLLFLSGGHDNAFDDDVDEQLVQDRALNVDNVFQADDCDIGLILPHGNNRLAPQFGLKRARVYSDLTPEEKDRWIWGAQNRVGNVNPGKARPGQARPVQENGAALDAEQLLFLSGGHDNAFDDDVDEQLVQDRALNVDNVFQADDCDVFDSDVDEAPTAQTMFMANLSSADPVTDEAKPSYDSNILSEVPDHDHYQDAACAHHKEHVMHDS
nr:hypothetical protein [Tanacetum cinerariifolium]